MLQQSDNYYTCQQQILHMSTTKSKHVNNKYKCQQQLLQQQILHMSTTFTTHVNNKYYKRFVNSLSLSVETDNTTMTQ